MTMAPKMKKNQPRSRTSSLKNGNTSDVANGARPSWAMAMQAATAMTISMAKRVRAETPLCDCLVTLRKSS